MQCESAKVTRGEASLITVRGKRKLGYEFDVELIIQIDSNKVKVKIIEMCDDEEDCTDFSV